MEDVFDEETQINEHEITVFLEGEDGRYGRLEETHYQRAYTLEQMKAALLKAGMEFVAAYEAFTEEGAGSLYGPHLCGGKRARQIRTGTNGGMKR